MKPVIVIDFNGALLNSRPFDEAHRQWFKMFSILLDDPSINEWADKENYFEGVHQVMKRYLGNVHKDAQLMFARQTFALVMVAEVKESDIVKDFASYLDTIKDKYTLALITTAPEGSVEPILEKIGCQYLFEIVFKSPYKSYPDKRELFEEFILKYERPLFYIGEGDKDIGLCRDLGIKSISVNWVKRGKFKGDHDIDDTEELKKIL
jgi:phosphoglycolate phosphatase-like HAD superfamily hydrolase